MAPSLWNPQLDPGRYDTSKFFLYKTAVCFASYKYVNPVVKKNNASSNYFFCKRERCVTQVESQWNTDRYDHCRVEQTEAYAESVWQLSCRTIWNQVLQLLVWKAGVVMNLSSYYMYPFHNGNRHRSLKMKIITWLILPKSKLTFSQSHWYFMENSSDLSDT